MARAHVQGSGQSRKCTAQEQPASVGPYHPGYNERHVRHCVDLGIVARRIIEHLKCAESHSYTAQKRYPRGSTQRQRQDVPTEHGQYEYCDSAVPGQRVESSFHMPRHIEHRVLLLDVGRWHSTEHGIGPRGLLIKQNRRILNFLAHAQPVLNVPLPHDISIEGFRQQNRRQSVEHDDSDVVHCVPLEVGFQLFHAQIRFASKLRGDRQCSSRRCTNLTHGFVDRSTPYLSSISSKST